MISISTRKYEGQSGMQLNICNPIKRVDIEPGRILVYGKGIGDLTVLWTPDTKFYVEVTK